MLVLRQVHIHPDAKTGAHHHGHLESVIYVLKGKARMRWGDKLQFTAEVSAWKHLKPTQPATAKECMLRH